MGTNKCASQAGMTAYGTRRHLYDPKTHTDKPFDQTTISLQMGTNKGASQVTKRTPSTHKAMQMKSNVVYQELKKSRIKTNLNGPNAFLLNTAKQNCV